MVFNQNAIAQRQKGALIQKKSQQWQNVFDRSIWRCSKAVVVVVPDCIFDMLWKYYYSSASTNSPFFPFRFCNAQSEHKERLT